MAINNKTLSSIQGKVTGLTTNETDFREGIDDTLVQVNATEVLLQGIDSTDITKLSEITATSSELNILGHCISELIGIIRPEEVLNNIFDNFCIGK